MKLIILTPFLFCILMAVGCGNKPTTTEAPKSVFEFPNENRTEDNFPAFWTAFRNAVLENKMDEIKKRTKFPLKTKGIMDEDAEIDYSENEFEEMFKLFLNMPTGLNPDNFNETHKEYITNNKEIIFEEFKNPRITDLKDMATVASFVFYKDKDGWKITMLYLDEDIYTKTGKQALSNK